MEFIYLFILTKNHKETIYFISHTNVNKMYFLGPKLSVDILFNAPLIDFCWPTVVVRFEHGHQQ